MSELTQLREEVYEANLELVRRGLVLYTFGNASGCLRGEGLVAIKPSGVPYEELRPADLVIVSLDGRIVEGSMRPSSDLPTHLVLYRAFASIGGVVHTHSSFATAWAQAGREIPCLGTTHADYFHGGVPVTDPMQPGEIEGEYERNTGDVIVRRFASLDADRFPAVLVAGHAPFCWGPSPHKAAHTAVILEEIARIAYYTVTLNPRVEPISPVLHDKHFLRKHGPGSYYGQPPRS
ncbi:MAG TPA: L-ribulose-5-phosphate 4-epimerase [Bryobacteraceae bacterium]|nr:L-ribulose-5-phosphate 4-epimerase [Bryobacteraceae bacterium]